MLAATSGVTGGLDPAYGRFHVDAFDRLHAVIAGTRNGSQNEKSGFGNFLLGVEPEGSLRLIPLTHPFRTFFTSTPRGGSKTSNTIDLFGSGDDAPRLRYAEIQIRYSN